MRRAVELADVHHVVLVLEDGCLIVVHVEVVGRREDGDQRREARVLRLLVHAIAARQSILSYSTVQVQSIL